MSDRIKIAFAVPALPAAGTLVVFAGDDGQLTAAQRKWLG